MSIYITGDAHANFKDIRFNNNASKNPFKKLTKDDIVIVCGDFGFDWNNDVMIEWNSLHREYTTLFCSGNHENYDILNNLPRKEMFGDEVGIFGPNTFYLLTGHMYTIDNKKFFVFGGAASIDKDWRIIEEMKNNQPRTLWWSDEVPSEDQFELAKKTLADHNYTFDYFISHTCRPDIKGPILHSYKADFYDPTETMINSLEYLIRENNGSWKASFFGHFHENISFETYHCLYTSVVNITEEYVLVNGLYKEKFYINYNDKPIDPLPTHAAISKRNPNWHWGDEEEVVIDFN